MENTTLLPLLTLVYQKLFKMEFFQTGVFPNFRHPFLGEEKPVGNIPTGSTNYIPSFAFINKILSFTIGEKPLPSGGGRSLVNLFQTFHPHFHQCIIVAY
jgi:hypothetical protein